MLAMRSARCPLCLRQRTHDEGGAACGTQVLHPVHHELAEVVVGPRHHHCVVLRNLCHQFPEPGAMGELERVAVSSSQKTSRTSGGLPARCNFFPRSPTAHFVRACSRTLRVAPASLRAVEPLPPLPPASAGTTAATPLSAAASASLAALSASIMLRSVSAAGREAQRRSMTQKQRATHLRSLQQGTPTSHLAGPCPCATNHPPTPWASPARKLQEGRVKRMHCEQLHRPAMGCINRLAPGQISPPQ